MTLDELREQRSQAQFGRPYRELDDFYRSRVNDALEIEAKALRAVDPIGANSGVTQKQLTWLFEKIAKATAETIDEQLPGVVRAHIRDELPKLVQPLIERAIATSEANTAASVQAAVTAAETAAAAIGRAQGATPDSHERRLERHADHLAALETRVKKLERGS